jgi:hypothetical protein
MQERQEFLDHYFVFRDRPEAAFAPARGRGLLAELRTSHRQVAERRKLEAAPPETLALSHERRAPLELPSVRAEVSASIPPSMPSINVTPPARTTERIER